MSKAGIGAIKSGYKAFSKLQALDEKLGIVDKLAAMDEKKKKNADEHDDL